MSGSWYVFAIIPAILAAAVALLLIAYFKALRLARKRLAGLGSQTLETDCGVIEYARVGQGYPLLVVHGAMGGFDHGLWVGQGFAGTGFQLISVSRFGYLRSSLPADASLNLQADAFACLLDALGIQKAAVFAVSAGSTSAIRFAARHPGRVTALVLFGPDSPGQEQLPMPPRFIYEAILGSNFIYWLLSTFFAKQLRSTMGLAPAGYQLTADNERLIKNFLTNAMPVRDRMDGLMYDSYTALDEFNQSVTPASPYPLGGIQAPVLVVHAQDDPLAVAANVQALADLMPSAQRYCVPEGGHLFFGHTNEVAQKILQFMQSHVAELQDGQPSS
jgi:pimeloyl-ACP methyl ester carboxylesterase